MFRVVERKFCLLVCFAIIFTVCAKATLRDRAVRPSNNERYRGEIINQQRSILRRWISYS